VQTVPRAVQSCAEVRRCRGAQRCAEVQNCLEPVQRQAVPCRAHAELAQSQQCCTKLCSVVLCYELCITTEPCDRAHQVADLQSRAALRKAAKPCRSCADYAGLAELRRQTRARAASSCAVSRCSSCRPIRTCNHAFELCCAEPG
jgi:hypothetical protein